MRNLVVLRDERRELPCSAKATSACITADGSTQRSFVLDDQGVLLCVAPAADACWLTDLNELVPCSDWVSAQYVVETDTIICFGADGAAVQVDSATGEAAHVASVPGGVRAAAWSPDQELVALFTGEDSLQLLSPELEVVAEEGCDPSRGDAPARLAWRGDGQYLVVSTTDAATGRVTPRVWTRELELHAACRSDDDQPVDGLGHPLAWRPDGAMIASTLALRRATQVVFFERNGLRHGEFTLHDASPKRWATAALSWDASSDLLLVLGGAHSQGPGTQTAQVWHRDNYAWDLKWQWGGADAILAAEWDAETHGLLRLTTAAQSPEGADDSPSCRLRTLEFALDYTVSPGPQAVVATVAADALRLTTAAGALVPPPLCEHSVPMPDPPREVAFAPHPLLTDRAGAVLTAAGSLLLCATPDAPALDDAWRQAVETHGATAIDPLRPDAPDLEPRPCPAWAVAACVDGTASLAGTHGGSPAARTLGVALSEARCLTWPARRTLCAVLPASGDDGSEGLLVISLHDDPLAAAVHVGEDEAREGPPVAPVASVAVLVLPQPVLRVARVSEHQPLATAGEEGSEEEEEGDILLSLADGSVLLARTVPADGGPPRLVDAAQDCESRGEHSPFPASGAQLPEPCHQLAVLHARLGTAGASVPLVVARSRRSRLYVDGTLFSASCGSFARHPRAQFLLMVALGPAPQLVHLHYLHLLSRTRPALLQSGPAPDGDSLSAAGSEDGEDRSGPALIGCTVPQLAAAAHALLLTAHAAAASTEGGGGSVAAALVPPTALPAASAGDAQALEGGHASAGTGAGVGAPSGTALLSIPRGATANLLRPVERGARLVSANPCAPRVVLQMPRGNLEAAASRALVLSRIRHALHAHRHATALHLARTHRVDLNLVVDHDPGAFLKGADALVDAAESVDHVNLLVAALDEEDCTHEDVGALPHPPWDPRSAAGADRSLLQPSKVNACVDAVLAALDRAALRDSAGEGSPGQEGAGTDDDWLPGPVPWPEAAGATNAPAPTEEDVKNAVDPIQGVIDGTADGAGALTQESGSVPAPSQPAPQAPRHAATRRMPGQLACLAHHRPPRLAQALRRIHALRRLADRERGVAFLAVLAPVDTLFNVALGLYDFPLVRMVAQRSVRDPREYRPLLRRLQQLPPPLREHAVDMCLGRYDRALHHLLAAGPQHLARALAITRRHDVQHSLLEAFPASTHPRLHALARRELGLLLLRASQPGFKPPSGGAAPSALLVAVSAAAGPTDGSDPAWNKGQKAVYAQSRLDRARTAVTVFLSSQPPDLELALQAVRLALDWRTALWLANRLGWDQPRKTQLARDMAHDLSQQQGSREASRDAAILLATSGGPERVSKAVTLYCAAREWREARRFACEAGRSELVNRLVVPTLQKTARRLRSVLVERSKRIDHIVTRLEDIRSKQRAMPAPDAGGDEGEDDAASVLSAASSLWTTATGASYATFASQLSVATGFSSASAASGQKQGGQSGAAGGSLVVRKFSRTLVGQTEGDDARRASAASSRRQRKRRTQQRRKVPKEGSPFEEEFLCQEVPSLLPSSETLEEVRGLLHALLEAGDTAGAAALQDAAGQLLSTVKTRRPPPALPIDDPRSPAFGDTKDAEGARKAITAAEQALAKAVATADAQSQWRLDWLDLLIGPAAGDAEPSSEAPADSLGVVAEEEEAGGGAPGLSAASLFAEEDDEGEDE